MVSRTAGRTGSEEETLMPLIPPGRVDQLSPAIGTTTAITPTTVTVFHIGPRDQDLYLLSDILDRADWKMCPNTRWSLAAADDEPSVADRLLSEPIPIVLCERQSLGGNWRDVLESVGRIPASPLLIVTSRTADEYLWAEALNLGAYDVLSKPYFPAEVIRVLSMAWLHWANRRVPAIALKHAC
jgi:CheY-like chemotaxis protein